MEEFNELFPELFPEFLMESEKIVKVDLARILEENPELTFDEIKNIIFRIKDYYRFFYDSEDKENNLYDKFLNLYGSKMTAEEKLIILFKIGSKDSFCRFALKHYDTLKKEIEKRVFISDPFVFDTETLEEFQVMIDSLYENENYQADWWYNIEFDMLVDLYKIFGENIKLFNRRKIEKYDLNHLCSLDEKDLEALFVNEFSIKHPKDIGKFLTVFSYQDERNYFSIIEKEANSFFSKLRSLVKTNKDIRNILEGIKEEYTDSVFKVEEDTRYYFSMVYNELLREKVARFDCNDDCQLRSVFDINFLKALNELSKYTKEELRSSTLYLNCFKVFLTEFLKNYKEQVNNQTLVIIETLFKRVIQKKNIFDILYINNEKSLWHFYKTDEFVGKFHISVDVIKRANGKQYKSLKNKYIEKFTNADEKIFKRNVFGDMEAEMIIILMDVFGFDKAKKLIFESLSDLKILLKYLDNKPDDCKRKIKKALGNGFGNILESYGVKMTTLLACFDTLYVQGYPNITTSRLIKSISSLSYALLPSNSHINADLEKLNMVAKGNPLLEKLEGIKLFDKYRFRIDSSIPDIEGYCNNCDYFMVDMHSPKILSNGIGNYLLPNNKKASSCLTPNGKASSCLRHGALNPNGRFFKVEHNGKTIAYSWVWRAGDVVCFDNIEVTDELLKLDNYEKVLFDIYKQATEKLIEKTQKEESKGVQLVVLGRNAIDLANKYFDNLAEVDCKERFKPNVDGEIYLKDSSGKQLILGGEITEDIQTEDVSPIYKYQRPKVKHFSEITNEDLTRKIDAIYFDYCLKNNKKYQSRRNVYSDGFLGEDWFYGKKRNDSWEFYFCGDDERLFLEAKDYAYDLKANSQYKLKIIRPDKKIINDILNAESSDMEINYEKLDEYFKRNSKEQFDLLQEYYIHFPGTLENFVSILENSAITSSEYGKHAGGSGCNGKHYISVAKVNSYIYNKYLYQGAFIIDSDICALSNDNNLTDSKNDFFKYSSYPFRITNFDGEYHVLNSISLDKVKAIFASEKDINKLVKIVYIQELFENKLPLVAINDNSYIEQDVIKKYCKIRKL